MDRETESDVIGALKGLYLKQLKERLYTLEQARVELSAWPGQRRVKYESLQFEVHRLNGTGATYGFPKISKAADTLEDHLRSEACEPRTVVKLLDVLIREIADTLVESQAHAPVHSPVFINKPSTDRSPGRPTVLVVDDDPAILNLVMQLISPWTNVEFAECGADAVKAMERRRYDLVILDHELPDMTGLDVLTKTHARMPSEQVRSPVMMLTGDTRAFGHGLLPDCRRGPALHGQARSRPDKLIERVSLVLNRQKKMILVVDDDPLIREIFRKKLHAARL